MVRLFALTLATLVLSGCGTLNTAKNNQFACQGDNCPTPIEVYSQTSGSPESIAMGRTPSQWGVPATGKKGSRTSTQKDRQQSTAALSLVEGVGAQPNTMIATTAGLAQPVRTPAQVMRVWIAPWIDKDDNLHMNGFVYTEVASRTWAFGGPEVRANNPLSLSQPVPVN